MSSLSSLSRGTRSWGKQSVVIAGGAHGREYSAWPFRETAKSPVLREPATVLAYQSPPSEPAQRKSKLYGVEFSSCKPQKPSLAVTWRLCRYVDNAAGCVRTI